MTRKDYIVLARALETSRNKIHARNGAHTDTELSVFWEIVGDIAAEIKSDNPRFNVERFAKTILSE